MALSHAVSYQNMSLHPPTPVPFFDKIKSAPCYSSFLGHGRVSCNGTPSPEFSPQSRANYGESNLAQVVPTFHDSNIIQ
jgi:hypothetical protein